MAGTGRIAIVLLFLMSLATGSLADAAIDMPGLPGAPPGPSVKHWLRFRVIGNTFQAARPIIWISPQAFGRRGPDQLSLLAPREYKALLGFAHSYRCSKSGDADIEPDTLLVTEYATGLRADPRSLDSC